MERVAGAEIGAFVRALHEEHGVIFHLEETVNAIDGARATLKSGLTLEADLVVVGVGVTPFASDRVDSNVRDLVAEAVLDCLRDAEMTDLKAVQHSVASYESDHFNRQMTLTAILQTHRAMR